MRLCALQLYRDVWSEGNIEVLESIMDSDHAQLDVLWQSSRGGDGGRERMARGIAAYRQAYPDIDFMILGLQPSLEAQSATVEWKASYTPKESDVPTVDGRSSFHGVSILEFNDAGLIRETRVYRQPPEGEMRHFSEKKKQADGA